MSDLKLPVALVLAMAVQLVAAVWWVSKQAHAIATLQSEVTELRTYVNTIDLDVQDLVTFKRLHKLIMTSEAYRMSTHHPQMNSLQNTDPDNHLLAYREPRRLSAEELRDSMLVSTGELNREIGGLPIMILNFQ